MPHEKGGSIELVQFHGDQIAAIRGQDGRGYAGVKRISLNIGMDSDTQIRKLKAAHWSGTLLMTASDERGRPQELWVIPFDRVPMWLATILRTSIGVSSPEDLVLFSAGDPMAVPRLCTSAGRVKEDLRPGPPASIRRDGRCLKATRGAAPVWPPALPRQGV